MESCILVSAMSWISHGLDKSITYMPCEIGTKATCKSKQLTYRLSCTYVNVTRFAKTRNNPAFLKTQIFTSWCSTYLKPSSVAVSSLHYK